MIPLKNGCPVPDIYKNVPFDEYLSWDAISNSSLHAAKRSMKHFYCRRPVDETPAMVQGSAVHTLFFEAPLFWTRFAVMPEFEKQIEGAKRPKATKEYKSLVEKFEDENRGKTVIETGAYQEAVAMVAAIREHRLAGHYFHEARSQFEVAIVWIDEETGLRCKGRMDAWDSANEIISDLKTTSDPSDFERQFFKRAYHRQGAFYCDGIEQLTGHEHSFTLTAVESSYPFCVRSAPVSDKALNAGREEYRSLLNQIAGSTHRNEWPGFESPDEWQLPTWAQSKDDVELVIDGQTVRL